MPPPAQPSPYLQNFLDGSALRAVYQPLVSLRQQKIVGYEGLIRGTNHATGAPVSPGELFAHAARERRTADLDHSCRRKVLDSFREIHQAQPDLVLSLNFDASVLDQGTEDPSPLRHLVQDAGINPSTVMLEIIESDCHGVEALRRFIATHKAAGFLIALDDVGAGHSNLNRIPLLKPDIIKIDRYLVQNLANDFYKREVFKALVRMSRTIGALTISEGVETREEAWASLELGADLIQGYYFSVPLETQQLETDNIFLNFKHPDSLNLERTGTNNWKARVDQLTADHKDSTLENLRIKRSRLRRYDMLTRDIQAELGKCEQEELDQNLKKLVHFYPLMECFYILNESGVQITDRVFVNPKSVRDHGCLFHPSPKGSDHSMRDYYFMLFEAGLDRLTFVTEPYLSMASGTLCVTYARIFRNTKNHRFMLCTDINANSLDQLRAEAPLDSSLG